MDADQHGRLHAMRLLLVRHDPDRAGKPAARMQAALDAGGDDQQRLGTSVVEGAGGK